MTTQNPRIAQRVTRWITAWLSTQKGSEPATIEFLAGDGSPRQFFRVKTGPLSYVVLFDDQWAFSKDYAAHQQFLNAAHLPVPAFLKEDPEAGFLVMEDLGDELLQFRLLSDPSRRLAWLESATRLLADIHAQTFPVPGTLPAASRHFDAKKYGEEMAFTFEHLHEKYLGLPPLAANQQKTLSDFCAEIAQMKPVVFCHRDYHCRNLLVRNNRLYMIDFQDARLGPPHYDLASLLFDAYVEMTEEQRLKLYSVYRERLRGTPLDRHIHWEMFHADLEAIALQRVVKAAGSFASFFTRYGKDSHLPYLAPALASAAYLAGRSKGKLKAFAKVFPIATWQQAAEKKR